MPGDVHHLAMAEILYQFRRSPRHSGGEHQTGADSLARRLLSMHTWILRHAREVLELRDDMNASLLCQQFLSVSGYAWLYLRERDLLADAYWRNLKRTDLVLNPCRPRPSDTAGALLELRAALFQSFRLVDAITSDAQQDAEDRDRACAALLAGTARADLARGAIVAVSEPR